MTAFEEMGVLSEIARAVEEMDWTLPTDVQAEAIPLILGGGDVLMAAETGSGKTGAFCLPIVQIVWETLKDIADGKTNKTVSQEFEEKWLLSFTDRTKELVVSPDGLRCQSRHQREWHGCRATKGVACQGRYYYETMVTDEGLCRVGWSTFTANLDLGTCKSGYGFGGTGKKSNCKQFDDYGQAFGKSDVIGCCLNLDDLHISFKKNGEDLGTAFHISKEFKNDAFCPAVVLKNAEMAFNFGDQPFKYPPPPGYIGISKTDPSYTRTVETVTCTKKEQQEDLRKSPQAIIIEPSRELAEQTYNQIKLFMKYLKNPTLHHLLITGGVNVKEQFHSLSTGTDIIVATPGRLEDIISGGHLLLDKVRFFVLDEVDGLLKQGCSRQIENMHQSMRKITPEGRRLQMVMCSATLHDFDVKKLSEKIMYFPTWIDLKGEDAVPETVHHVVVMVDPQKDQRWHNLRTKIQTDAVHMLDPKEPNVLTAECLSEAIKLLKGEYCIQAIREHKMDRAIIFCRTKVDCDNLERYFRQLRSNDFSCVCLHADRQPAERRENLDKFKNKEVRFLICTDVAARGLDINGLPFMINMTLPDEKSNYVHRIGRVGRAERMGLAISLVAAIPEKVWFHGQWCPSRGKHCKNTAIVEDGGCCIWYNEMQCLADIEDHLNVTIQQVECDLKVPLNEFDGKVVYGQKKLNSGNNYQNHVAVMAPAVQELAGLESKAQLSFLKRHYGQQR